MKHKRKTSKRSRYSKKRYGTKKRYSKKSNSRKRKSSRRYSKKQRGGDKMEELRSELEKMKMSALQKRAIADGVSDGEIEAAVDSDNPKEAIITAIVSQLFKPAGQLSQDNPTYNNNIIHNFLSREDISWPEGMSDDEKIEKITTALELGGVAGAARELRSAYPTSEQLKRDKATQATAARRADPKQGWETSPFAANRGLANIATMGGLNAADVEALRIQALEEGAPHGEVEAAMLEVNPRATLTALFEKARAIRGGTVVENVFGKSDRKKAARAAAPVRGSTASFDSESSDPVLARIQAHRMKYMGGDTLPEKRELRAAESLQQQLVDSMAGRPGPNLSMAEERDELEHQIAAIKAKQAAQASRAHMVQTPEPSGVRSGRGGYKPSKTRWNT